MFSSFFAKGYFLRVGDAGAGSETVQTPQQTSDIQACGALCDLYSNCTG